MHQIPISLPLSPPPSLADNMPMCREHNRPLDYFCEKCDVLVCATCAINTHGGHKVDMDTFSRKCLLIGSYKILCFDKKILGKMVIQCIRISEGKLVRSFSCPFLYVGFF